VRLTLVISSLFSGGAEVALSLMANYWAHEGRQITLLTFDDGSTPPFYKLDPRIKHQPLGLARDSSNTLVAVRNNLRRVRRLRSAIRRSRPQCVISLMDQVNVLTLLATRGIPVPVIVMEQNNPALYPIGRPWALLRNRLYPKADRVVVLTERMIHCFPPQIRARWCVIPNPVSLPAARDDSPAEKLLERPALLAVGRLTEQKGFDLLLDAFAQLGERHADWTLTILGDGPLRRELECQRQRLNLTGRVRFLGRVPNPSDFMRQADVFVLSSRYEGFPMALCEAMSCGVAVVAADCLTGPREIIRDGVDGLLVPTGDAAALASALSRLMSDEGLRSLLGNRARAITERFDVKKVMGMWEELLGLVIRERD
jgi:GalNAc-alpha-(1->4)-GalNAc-alpha-(1->3)-diNAcBac-PP-undecaprenol alpha-1,4-N-acetyl-D-galactosaminyltransferase